MTPNCDCCTGPLALSGRAGNRPGLNALSYRLGTHATFLDALLARLSSSDLPALAHLRTRDRNDPAIALLDAWATVADVLTFYQERIANEGYLRTATERRSVLELARLVGYRLRPGVAASVYLAFTMEPGFNENARVPKGTRSQSLPAPGEMPQSFETEQNEEARTEWNQLLPRLTRPQFITLSNAAQKQDLYFVGSDPTLKANDPLLLVFGNGPDQQVVRQIRAVEVSPDKRRTQVKLLPLATELPPAPIEGELIDPVEANPSAAAPNSASPNAFIRTTNFSPFSTDTRTQLEAATGRISRALPTLTQAAIKALSQPPSLPPANAKQLKRSQSQAFAPAIDIASQLLVNLNPALRPTLYSAWGSTSVEPKSGLATVQTIEKFGIKASLFGHNAPLKPVYENNQGHPIRYEEWPLTRPSEIVWRSHITPAEGRAPTSNPSPATLNVLAATTQEDAASPPLPIALPFNSPRVTTPLGQTTTYLSASMNPQGIQVRFIHAVPGVGRVDVQVNEQVLFENVEPLSATDYQVVPVPTQSMTEGTSLIELAIQVFNTGEQGEGFIRQSFTVEATPGQAYAVIAIPPSPGDEFSQNQVVVEPDAAAIDRTLQVKVLHAATNLGTATVRLGQEGLLANNEPLTFGNFAIATQTSASGTYTLSIETTLRNQLISLNTPVALKAGSAYQILLLEGQTAATPLEVKVLESPLMLENQLMQLIFGISELQYEFRVIGFANNRSRLTVQAINGTVLSRSFSPGRVLRETVNGLILTVQGGLRVDNPLEIRVEFEATAGPVAQKTLALDAQYDQILPGSWVVINRPDRQIVSRVLGTQAISKAEYGITGKVTQLTLDQPWLDASDRTLATLRQTTLYAQSEPLDVAEEVIDPVNNPIGRMDANADEPFEIELAQLYDGLKPGRWLIVSGERADIPGAQGVRASELVMLAGVRQGVAQVEMSPATPDANLAPAAEGGEGGEEAPVQPQLIDLPGDTPHSFLQLAQPLAYQYKRDTVTIHGNVVKATHGETRGEVLGSGDGSKALQQFALSKPPLTYLSAPTREGVESTLEVRVNDVKWQEVENLAWAKDTDHGFITRTDDDDKTTVVFGDGVQGARLPSGSENVKAVYRDGIGQVGNVKAEQIKLLATRPLGVKGVINPLPATGGANRETLLQAKRNAPMAVMALDRLVSVQDYADFVRTFAGIAKADAQALSNGRRELIHLTIAGADNIPIEKNSDLYRNLWRALRRFGDPYQPLQIDLRELMILLISVRVRILPDYLWEPVKVAIEAALFDYFSFERRDLGQDVLMSEVISTIHQVPGVDYVDVDILDSVSETEAEDPDRLANKLLQLAQPDLFTQEGASPINPEPFSSGSSSSGSSSPEDSNLEALSLEASSPALEALAPQPRPRITASLAQVSEDDSLTIRPAQLAILSPNLPETLKLEEITL
ncbi:putative baseplate assembly protein [Pseudanabaena sp. FACHB-2040]|uniref:putative baseplate assembly protein n=1 Tax=Pseudanabaena sp. FACHB-2040 TaxID=2692859 RepID=UPI0016872F5A|nr:putative baseplate assembly protein [Pseudanabaena sp. FACHB-2040]MBD2261434.1 putative baseplate assembly protein [Pseudanabaena sp. FACHB-2040]